MAREGQEVRAEELGRTEHRARASTHVERSLSRDFDELGDPVEDAHFGGLGKGRACLMREGRKGLSEGVVGGKDCGVKNLIDASCYCPLLTCFLCGWEIESGVLQVGLSPAYCDP